MLKKVIPIAVCLCLMFSMCVMAENTEVVSDEAAPQLSEQMPQWGQEAPQADPGNMGMPPSGEMPTRGTPPDMPKGEMPQGMNRGQKPSGNFNPQQGFDGKNNTEVTPPPAEGNVPAENSQFQGGNSPFGGQMPEGMGGFPGNMQNFNQQPQEQAPVGFLGFVKTNSTPITSVILLALAFVFVIFYRRKNY